MKMSQSILRVYIHLFEMLVSEMIVTDKFESNMKITSFDMFVRTSGTAMSNNTTTLHIIHHAARC